MNLSDWRELLSSAALIYFAWQQNQIFRKQNEIFTIQAGQQVVPPSGRFRFYWPLGVMFAIVAINVGISAYDYYDRHQHSALTFEQWQIYRKKTIVNTTFTGVDVPLDGRDYVDCVFNDVVLVFNGSAPTMLHNPRFGGKIRLRSKDPSILAFMELATGLGMLSPAATFTHEQSQDK